MKIPGLKRTKPAPKYETWEFIPQPDITAYELAVFFRHLTVVGEAHLKFIAVRAGDPRPFEKEGADFSRHFRRADRPEAQNRG